MNAERQNLFVAGIWCKTGGGYEHVPALLRVDRRFKQGGGEEDGVVSEPLESRRSAEAIVESCVDTENMQLGGLVPIGE